MKALLLFFCVSALPAYADWKVLPRGDHAAEIAADFEIESVRIDPNGDSVMTVFSKEKNGEIGFTLKIASPFRVWSRQLGVAVSDRWTKKDAGTRQICCDSPRHG